MFYSTRDFKIKLHASEAILKGISDEGGLFLPCEIKEISVDSLLNKSYPEMAYEILKAYLDDYTPEEIRACVDKAYGSANFPEKIVGITTFGSYSFLELFHGQTLTFKDMALSLLPHLMEAALKKHPERKEIHILTATSGDTGSAVLSSFRSSENIKVSVLYPDNGVAPLQERQMLSFTSPRGRAYGLKGSNFDDCQTLVKKLLVEKPFGKEFSSANSINIGRLLPQVVYYYFAYADLVKEKTIKNGELLDVVVPTGNFGDIFAAYLAKKMSLPLGRLVVASNSNRILTDFFQKGVYDTHRKFLKTSSPSMDILVSSNLERLLSLTANSDAKVASLMENLAKRGYFSVDSDFLKSLQKDFVGYSSDEKETDAAIQKSFKENHYLLDPHSAVGYASYLKFSEANGKNHCLVVATASPLKFPVTIAHALGIEEKDDLLALQKIVKISGLKIPSQWQAVLDNESPKFIVRPAEFKNLLSPKAGFIVKVPATSANLGPGFDVCGLALNLYNVFEFSVQGEDFLEGFVGEEELKDNLVQKSYKRFFAEYHLPYVPVKISLKECDIPLSRGLGSSASCIVAGLLAANEIAGRYLPKKKLLGLASKIEGHPDNVGPCLLGGLVGSYKVGDDVHPVSYSVSPKLGFLLCIPEQELATAQARQALPSSYSLADVTYNASHLIHLPRAFEEGDLVLLNNIIDDKVHVPYRLPLIKEGGSVRDICAKYLLPFTISGAGSSLLVIYKKDHEDVADLLVAELKKKLKGTWVFKKLSSVPEGASIFKEEDHE